MKSENNLILFIIESLSSGGAERVTSTLANLFSERGHVVYVLIRRKSVETYKLNTEIRKIYFSQSRFNGLIGFIINNIIMFKTVRRLKVKTIISLSTPETNKLLFANLLVGNQNIILSERNDPASFPKSNRLKFIRNIEYLLSDKIVFQTEGALRYFNKNIRKKGVIILNPIKDGLPERYIGKRDPIIVTYCRLEPQKNLFLLVDAFKEISKDYSEFQLHIYGNGKQKNALINYVHERRLEDKVEFHDYDSNIHQLILKNYMFVSTSDFEGLSNSMIESMAIGLPTICTDCPSGGAKMLIKPYDNGLLVPVRDVTALINAMKLIIDDQDLCKRLSENSIKIRDSLSKDSIYEKWYAIIK